DVFADATTAGRVYAIATKSSAATVLRSDDYAATFATFFDEPNGTLVGVESARTAPSTVYVAGLRGSVPYITQTIDGGNAFTTFMHSEVQAVVRIAAVDPVDAGTLYLRRTAGMGDSLLISTDGGKTLTDVLDLGEP